MKWESIPENPPEGSHVLVKSRGNYDLVELDCNGNVLFPPVMITWDLWSKATRPLGAEILVLSELPDSCYMEVPATQEDLHLSAERPDALR